MMVNGSSINKSCSEDLVEDVMCVRIDSLVEQEADEMLLRGVSGCLFSLLSKSFSKPSTGDSASRDSNTAPHPETSRIPIVSINCKGNNHEGLMVWRTIRNLREKKIP